MPLRVEEEGVVLELFGAGTFEEPGPPSLRQLFRSRLGGLLRFVSCQQLILAEGEEPGRREDEHRQQDERSLPEEAAARWAGRFHRGAESTHVYYSVPQRESRNVMKL